jgi:hypothetical protein
MTTVTNKTRRPLRVPLPGGKTLHLGPGKAGQISSKDADDPRLKKLVEDAVIEIVDEEAQRTSSGGDGGKKFASGGGRTPGSGSHRSGDR